MKKFKKINVETKEMLDELYSSSALTIEGLAEESVVDYLDDIEEKCGLKNRIAYITKGKTMNEVYGLTGTNAYLNELIIVSIKLSDIVNVSPLIVHRFLIGARWFDDIVDNNLMREEYKNE